LCLLSEKFAKRDICGLTYLLLVDKPRRGGGLVCFGGGHLCKPVGLDGGELATVGKNCAKRIDFQSFDCVAVEG
jgi:hypothetical protein